MRILAIDAGEKRIGLAMSDPMCIIASALKTLSSTDTKTDIEEIVKIVREHDVGEIVIGLPLKFDGTESQSTKKVIAFAEELKKAVSVQVSFQDERLTSKEAERLLISADVSRKKRKTVTDGMAAQLILQGYISSHKR